MQKNQRNSKVLLAAISTASRSLIANQPFDSDKVKQLQEVGFTNSTYIKKANDHEANHKTALAYAEKYPSYWFLSFMQMNNLMSDFDLYHSSLNDFRGDIPERVMADILNFRIERGCLEEISFKTQATQMVDTLFSGRDFGKSIFQDYMGAFVVPQVKTRLNMIPLTTAGYYPSTAILDANEDPKLLFNQKKVDHMNTLMMTFQEVNNEFPGIITVIEGDRDNDDDEEELNHMLLVIKVKAGSLIIADWPK